MTTSAEPSASRPRSLTAARVAAVAVAATAGAATLSACATTQQTASWIRLNNDRTILSQTPPRVLLTSSVVRPLDVSLVRSRHATAFVVRVHNLSARTVSDLPISVGYTAATGRRIYANHRGSLRYFNAHLPGVRPHQSLTWVFTTTARIPAGVRAFARVGTRAAPAAPAGSQPVPVSVTTKHISGHELSLVVTNNSTLPQYQLQVYSYARRGGRYVAAADVTLQGVNPGVTERVRLPLVGRLAGERPITTVVPTILQ